MEGFVGDFTLLIPAEQARIEIGFDCGYSSWEKAVCIRHYQDVYTFEWHGTNGKQMALTVFGSYAWTYRFRNKRPSTALTIQIPSFMLVYVKVLLISPPHLPNGLQ